MTTLRFSVAIAVYNGSLYLSDQINSIIDSFEYCNLANEYEIVCVDDCSSDNSVKILESLSTFYPIKIIRNNINLGHNKTFEIAVKECKSALIFFSDQDDIWPIDRVKVMSKAFHKFNPLLVCGNYQVFYDDDPTINYRRHDPVRVHESRWETFSIVLLNQLLARRGSHYYGSTMLFSSRLLSIALPYPPLFEEHDKWFALCASVAKQGFVRINALVTFRRIHNFNLTTHNRPIVDKYVTRFVILFTALWLLVRSVTYFRDEP